MCFQKIAVISKIGVRVVYGEDHAFIQLVPFEEGQKLLHFKISLYDIRDQR
jgi:hypothetical protein